MNFTELMKERRSIYELDDNVTLSDAAIQEMIEEVLDNTPSAFNAQTQRLVLLLGLKHREFWDLVSDQLKKIVPEAEFPKTEKKLSGFAKGKGTVLFFDAEDVTEELKGKYSLYAKNITSWAKEQNGMLQYAVWVAFREVNIGASLQHYNEIVSEQLAEAYDIPKSWKIVAQMPFGNILHTPEAKSRLPISSRMLVR
ncbi:MAG: nitroreductase family protein [Bacilli bacterium]|nr:nitroreductase family protein [Bacilli bacterium]